MGAGARLQVLACPDFAIDPATAEVLDRDGYIMLRGAIPDDWLEPLRDVFEACVLPSERWPVPRGHDWRHAMLDDREAARRVARLPVLLGCAFHILKGPFFVAQIEGREPRRDGGAQLLHRDSTGCDGRPQVAIALAFLDDFGPANGATRVAPASLFEEPEQGEAHAVTLEGRAGDIVFFDARLLHGGTRNVGGALRRSLLINYWARALTDTHVQTSALRGVAAGGRETFGMAPEDIVEQD